MRLPADEEKANLARRRSSLRLLCELYRVGLHHECLAILEIVRWNSPICSFPPSQQREHTPETGSSVKGML